VYDDYDELVEGIFGVPWEEVHMMRPPAWLPGMADMWEEDNPQDGSGVPDVRIIWRGATSEGNIRNPDIL